MNIFLEIIYASWDVLLKSSIFILFGMFVGGLLKVFLNPAFVAEHLGKGRFMSVIKAALFGMPIPLCSCGVLPAAASLKKHGANNGATTAFLISTPESGVDSIAITYALLDPYMTVARPVSAFVAAVSAGIIENIVHYQEEKDWLKIVNQTCPVDNCCDGSECAPEEHKAHHTFMEKIWAGLKFAVGDLWGDLAGWFWAGLLMAGIISVVIPVELMEQYLGGGLLSMLIMLVVGIPMYICATASTPIAAALILKGVSPGAALVFLLVGPATNITSLSVLMGILGKRASFIYLTVLSTVAVLSGLAVDLIYASMSLPIHASIGRSAEIVPIEVQVAGALLVILFSLQPLLHILKRFTVNNHMSHDHLDSDSDCGCSSSGCSD